jgi:hypothetical protein
MEEYLKINRDSWNKRTEIHINSANIQFKPAFSPIVEGINPIVEKNCSIVNQQVY